MTVLMFKSSADRRSKGGTFEANRRSFTPPITRAV